MENLQLYSSVLSDQETGQIKSFYASRTLDKNHIEFEKVEVNEAWLILRENVH